jgi:thiol:disulfide interchange protein DsbC
MGFNNKLPMKKKFFALTALGISLNSFACPTPQQTQEGLKKLFRVPIKVVQVKEAPVKGLCENVIKVGGQKVIFYTDESGRYLLLGSRPLVSIIDLKSGENLTQKELEKLNKLSKNQVHELDKYVAFTYGHKGKVVYLFTDPECPFCQRLEPTLKKLADEGKIQVKVILFPLPFHPHAKEKAVAAVCQNLGWNSLQRDYWTEEKMEKLGQWQCEEGKKLVEESIKIGQKYGVSGTPTMITEDGKKVVGALPEPMLKKELGLDKK